jgi:hypothetical protein
MRKHLLAVAFGVLLLLPSLGWTQFPRASVIRSLDVTPLPARAYWDAPLPLTLPNNYYGPRLNFYTPTYTYSDWYGNSYLPSVGWNYFQPQPQGAPSLNIQVR